MDNLIFDFEKNQEYLFDIVIENKQKRIQQIKALHIMAAILILVYAIRGFSDLPFTSIQLYLGFPAVIAILYLVFAKPQKLLNAKINRILRLTEAALICLCAIHFRFYKLNIVAISFFISALLFLLILIIEMQVLNGYQIKINLDGVVTNNGLQQKKYAWAEIENVVAKDAILTVDLKNNYLMQSKYSNELKGEELLRFNEWCRKRFAKDLI